MPGAQVLASQRWNAMEGKFQNLLYADSGNSDTWFIFQNIDGKNECDSLVSIHVHFGSYGHWRFWLLTAKNQ